MDSSLWWIDLGWLAGAHQATPSFPLLHETEENTRQKSSWFVMRKGRSLATYHHGQNRLDLGKFIEFIANHTK